MTSVTLKDRYLGSFLGMAIADYVGSGYEFKSRDSFKAAGPMPSYKGTWGLPIGSYTDDSSMALCLADSFLSNNGFDAADQLERYIRWRENGENSSVGRCFDIGSTCSGALLRYYRDKSLFAKIDEYGNGNGSLMRLAPIPLIYRENSELRKKYARLQSLVTHGGALAMDCCEVYADLIAYALGGANKLALWRVCKDHSRYYAGLDIRCTQAMDNLQLKKRSQINSGGFVLDSFEAALWCIFQTDTFEEAVLSGVNLGGDTDTTAAIIGQLAGAIYGIQGIPSQWVNDLVHRNRFEELATQMLEASDHHIDIIKPQ